MRPVYHPRLVNGPFGDPALYVPLTFRKQALLFDLGDLSALSPGDILKTDRIFISHTHIDHFIGFDQVLRLLLGRPKTLNIYGPKGLLENIKGKLQGYTWNLVNNYQDALTIIATEVDEQLATTMIFDGRTGFKSSAAEVKPLKEPAIFQCPEFTVTFSRLSHQIPCFGYCLQERFHINIMTSRLEALGLATGPWLTSLKHLIYTNADPGLKIEVAIAKEPPATRTVPLADLISKIVRITPGQKTAYITDVVHSPENEEKMIRLAHQVDHLFIEAVFLDREKEIAHTKAHLTARQAGIIARKAEVKRMTIFHHSPRYTGQGHLLVQEAEKAFRQEPD